MQQIAYYALVWPFMAIAKTIEMVVYILTPPVELPRPKPRGPQAIRYEESIGRIKRDAERREKALRDENAKLRRENRRLEQKLRGRELN